MGLSLQQKAVYKIFIESFCNKIEGYFPNNVKDAEFLLRSITSCSLVARNMLLYDANSKPVIDHSIIKLIAMLQDELGCAMFKEDSEGFKVLYRSIFALRHNLYLDKKELLDDNEVTSFSKKLEVEASVEEIQDFVAFVIDDFINNIDRSKNHNDENILNKQIRVATLYNLVSSGDLDKVISMLKIDASLIDELHENNEASMHAAVKYNNIEMVKLLSKFGANVNVRDKDLMTPLFYAVELGHVSMVEELLKLGAKINAQEKNGYSPLHLAIISHHIELVKLLIERGAEVDVRNYNGLTPMHSAVWEGDRDITEMLISNHASTNIADFCGLTPLHIAAISGNNDMTKFLIDKGANLSLKDDLGRTYEDYIN